MKTKPKLLAACLLLSMFAGCAGQKVAYKNLIDPETMGLAKKFAPRDTGRIEIIQPIAHLFAYLKAEYSVADWQRMSEAYRDTTKNLETHIQEIYGKSLYRIAGGEMQFKEKYPFVKFDSIDSFSIGFVKVIAPNKIPAAERAVIANQLAGYIQALDSILGLDSALKSRFEFGLARLQTNGQIPIFLVTNPMEAKLDGIKRTYAMATAGYYKTPADSAARYSVKIFTKYFGLISTSTMMHELVHAVVGLIQVSPDRLSIPWQGLKSLRKSMDTLTDSSQNMLITEGIAESISQRFNPMYNSGYFNLVDKNVVWQQNQYGHLHKFEDAGKCYTGRFCSFNGRILALYQANSFVNFLVQQYGYSKVIRLAICSPKEANYQALFGANSKDLYQAWLQTIEPVQPNVDR